MMIEELMYGVIPIANNVAFEKAPPESVLRYASIFVLESLLEEISFIASASAFASRNGTGITEPILNTMIIKSVNNIFLLKSGIDQAFFNTFNTLNHLCLSASSFNSSFS